MILYRKNKRLDENQLPGKEEVKEVKEAKEMKEKTD